MAKSNSPTNAIIVDVLAGIFAEMFKKERKRNCPYSYQHPAKKI